MHISLSFSIKEALKMGTFFTVFSAAFFNGVLQWMKWSNGNWFNPSMSPIFSNDDQTSEKLNPYHFQIDVIEPYILKSVSRIAVRDFGKTFNILMCCIIWFRVKTVKAGWEIKSQISDFAQEWRRQWGNWENFWTKENNIQRCTRSDSKGSGPFSLKHKDTLFLSWHIMGTRSEK